MFYMITQLTVSLMLMYYGFPVILH